MSFLSKSASLARQSGFGQCARTYASKQASGSPGSKLPLGLSALAAAGLLIGLDSYSNDSLGLRQLLGQSSSAIAADAEAEGVLIKDKWQAFTLSKIEPYNHNTKIYHFDFPADAKNKVTGIPVAGALLTKSPDGEAEIKDEKGKPVIRPYTPISPPEKTGSVTLMIKEYQGGKISPYIANLQPGKGQLMFKGPIIKYRYAPNTFDRGLCIAGGSGITPMYQLINYSLSLPEDKTKWTLIFSNVTEEDILLRKEWDALAKKNKDRLEVKYVLDKPSKTWSEPTGFVTADMISKIFPSRDQKKDKVMAFVCGPPPQVASVAGPKDGMKQGEVQGALKDLGYTKEEVFKF